MATPPAPLSSVTCTSVARAGVPASGADGTAAHPWPTLAALSANLAPGETGCLDAAGGTFHLAADLYVGSTDCDVRCRNGTTSSPITIASLPGARAKVATGPHRFMFTVQSHDWRIEGIDFAGAITGPWAALQVKGDRVTIHHSSFTTSRTGTCLEIGERFTGARRAARDVLVQANRFIGCGSATGDTAAVHVESSAAPGPQLRDNVIARSASAGVLLLPDAHATLVQRNVLHANRTGLVIGGGSGLRSSGNVVRANLVSFSSGTGAARGYDITTRWGAGSPGAGNVLAGNCLLKGTNRYEPQANIGPIAGRGLRSWNNRSYGPRWTSTRDSVATPFPFLASAPANFSLKASGVVSRCNSVISPTAPLPFQPLAPVAGRGLRELDPAPTDPAPDPVSPAPDPVSPAPGPVDPSPSCTRYVASSGTDSTAAAAGTSSTPYRTLQFLAGRLGAGETGCIMGAIPAPSTGNVLTFAGGGTEAAPITFTSAPGQRATVNGRWDISSAAHDVVISGLTLRYAGPQATAYVVSGSRISLRGNDISGFATCIGVGWRDGNLTGRDVVIDRNRIHDCGREQLATGSLPYHNQDHGIYVDSGLRTRILRNVIFFNAAKGVLLVPDARSTEVAWNVIDHNGSNVWFGDHNSGTYGATGSRVHHNILSMPHTRPADGYGYNVGAWWANLANRTGADNQVTSNCMYADAGSTNINTDGDSGGFTTTSTTMANPAYTSIPTRNYTVPTTNACHYVIDAAGAGIPLTSYSQ